MMTRSAIFLDLDQTLVAVSTEQFFVQQLYRSGRLGPGKLVAISAALRVPCLQEGRLHPCPAGGSSPHPPGDHGRLSLPAAPGLARAEQAMLALITPQQA